MHEDFTLLIKESGSLKSALSQVPISLKMEVILSPVCNLEKSGIRHSGSFCLLLLLLKNFKIYYPDNTAKYECSWLRNEMFHCGRGHVTLSRDRTMTTKSQIEACTKCGDRDCR